MKSMKKIKAWVNKVNQLKLIDRKVPILRLNKLGLDGKEIWIIIFRILMMKMKITTAN